MIDGRVATLWSPFPVCIMNRKLQLPTVADAMQTFSRYSTTSILRQTAKLLLLCDIYVVSRLSLSAIYNFMYIYVRLFVRNRCL